MSAPQIEALAALKAEHRALREAAASLLDTLRFDAHSCVGRRHEYLTIATKICTFAPPFAGCWYACDECAANPPADLPTSRTEDIRSAPAIRALRKLLEAP